tara:strand:- start:47 stop:271 length:225 start_codon:yes stop_codon:yes gene_type:complete
MIVNVQYKVFWQFKNATHFKVTKCKKIINCQTNLTIKQSLRGGSCGYWINKVFIKRKDLNSYLEVIPKKEILPF